MVSQKDMKNKEKNWKIDIKETLFRNFIWIPMIIFVMVFSILGMNNVNHFEDPALRMMFVIFYLFFMLKLFVWVGHPEIILREVEE